MVGRQHSCVLSVLIPTGRDPANMEDSSLEGKSNYCFIKKPMPWKKNIGIYEMCKS